MSLRLKTWNIILIVAALWFCDMIHGFLDDQSLLPSSFSTIYNDTTRTLASSWAIRIPSHVISPDIHKLADKIARDVGLDNRGQIGGLTGHYLLYHRSFINHTLNTSHNEQLQIDRIRRDISTLLESHPHVEWFNHETILRRTKRSLQFLDQYFPNQWHLVCVLIYYSCLLVAFVL